MRFWRSGDRAAALAACAWLLAPVVALSADDPFRSVAPPAPVAKPAPHRQPPEAPPVAVPPPPPAALPAVPIEPATKALADPGPTGFADEARDYGIPPQEIVHQGHPHMPTPLTVPGAARITTVQLYAELQAHRPMVLLYANEGGQAIVGSHWLFGAGRGTGFDDAVQERLRRKLEALTQGNKAAMIVTYCLDSHCWLSYNAALRAVKLGYRNVRWYRGGREAWHAAGLALVPVPQEAW